ncbi:MAG TPA: pyridoxamine 5'-phosphate oxidase family protein [Oscillospiraceae bacterium]|nr:pyridoxamine 5'-phosphate oxidase family protein [Oscillospiraceae bacterium]
MKKINDQLKEILSHPADGAVAIVTQGKDGPHVVNTWNSYIKQSADGRWLAPASRMNKTEENLAADNRVKLTVSSREVQGKMYKGTGFLITGTAEFLKDGPDFETIKGKFDWARAALAITIETAEQTL